MLSIARPDLPDGSPDRSDEERVADMDIRLTIEGNRLTTVTCGSAILTFPSRPSVSSGEFSAVGDDGGAISGRIVSDVGAVGTIGTAACPATRWAATKR